jgi:hypothetical protein
MWRIGQAWPHAQAEAAQPPAERSQQGRLAAQEMRRAADLDDQPVRAIERNGGPIAAAPDRQPSERLGIGPGHGRPGDEAWHNRTGIGQCHAGIQTMGSCRGIKSGQGETMRPARHKCHA